MNERDGMVGDQLEYIYIYITVGPRIILLFYTCDKCHMGVCIIYIANLSLTFKVVNKFDDMSELEWSVTIFIFIS